MSHGQFVFVSDFDGTLTKKDFYQMIIDDYLGADGHTLYKEWRQGLHEDKAFLSKIYSSINREEAEILEDILRIEWDEGAPEFIKKVRENEGEFIILSSGTNYYIDRFLKEKGLSDIKVYSIPGIYKDKGIHLQIDKNNPYYSEKYGIDKAKVIEDLKKHYTHVYYTGDSTPDIPPCKIADMAFAKGKLQDLLNAEGIDFVPVKSYKDITLFLTEKGVLKWIPDKLIVFPFLPY